MSDSKTEPKDSMKNPAEICVLVVDDDPQMRETSREILESSGYTNILEAKDGAEAVEILSSHSVDLIVSDWEMPHLSGIELLEALRRHKGKQGEIPFIMVTSQISQERTKIHEAAITGVDAYIVKPFRAQTLKDKVQQVLEKANKASKGALVVDDDPNIREIISEHLHNMKFDPILEAADGKQALAVLRKSAADISIILCDWEMPTMEGIELLRQIRQDPELRNMPFVMVTSQTSIEHMKLKQAIEAKVDQYLMKPFTGEQLKEKIDLVLKRSKLRKGQEDSLNRAQIALDSGMWAEAEAIYRKIIASDPKSIDAYLGLSATLLAQVPKKQFEDAIEFIKKAISLNPKLDRGYIQLAQAYESALSLDRAITTLQEASEICPLSDMIFYHLGRLTLRRGHTEKGIQYLENAQEINPNHQAAKDLLQQARAKLQSK